jgi:hypothetical protein
MFNAVQHPVQGSRGLPLERIGPVHVAAYIEKLGKELSRPTVKQQLAAIRMLFDLAGDRPGDRCEPRALSPRSPV